MQTKTKILLGIPTNRLIQPQTVQSLLEMVKESEDEIVVKLATQGYTIAENRNYLATQALKEKCTHLMMIDDDMIFPSNTLNRLLDHDVDFVGVVAHSRCLPPLPVVTTFDQEEMSVADRLLGKYSFPDVPFKVKGIGGGVVLIKTDLFNKIERPWFANENYDTGMTKVGEDYYFCNKVLNAGFDIWCDPTLKINHIGNYLY